MSDGGELVIIVQQAIRIAFITDDTITIRNYIVFDACKIEYSYSVLGHCPCQRVCTICSG